MPSDDSTQAAPIIPVDCPRTLLFVDDEPFILSSLQRLFRPKGFKILTAESGEAGLAILDSEKVDLVMADMRMPKMDGAQFLERVRAKNPDIMRLLLTGYADITSTINAINKGEIYRHVSKPWDDNDIVLIVNKALEHQALRGENQRLLALTQRQNDELTELNAGLEQRVQDRTSEIAEVNSFLKLTNERLKQNFLVSLKVFSGLIELREGAVAGHSRRVAELARRIAKLMNLSAKDQQDVFVASLLHDIGKIGFSDELLSQPVSSLNIDDLARYRKHALSSEAALMPLVDLQAAAKIIRSHHERFDGLGFPDGLSQDAIPQGARILAVANDYDGHQIGTLSDRRCNLEEAKTLIMKGGGKRYDPKVVNAFLDVIGGPSQAPVRYREIPAAELAPGMVSGKDILKRDGTLLLAADYVLDAAIVHQIQSYAIREGIQFMVSIRNDKMFRC